MEWTAVAFRNLSDKTLWNEVLLLSPVCLFTPRGMCCCCSPLSVRWHILQWTAVAFPSLSVYTSWNGLLLLSLVCRMTHFTMKSCCFPQSWNGLLLLSLVCQMTHFTMKCCCFPQSVCLHLVEWTAATVCLHIVDWAAVAFPSLSVFTFWNGLLLLSLVCLMTHCGMKCCCFS